MPDSEVHLDKRLTIGHVITTLSLLVAVVVWGTRLEERLDHVVQQVADYDHNVEDHPWFLERIGSTQAHVTANARENVRQDEERLRLVSEIKAELVRMNEKMDKLLLQLGEAD